jgi:hypothetical protein
VTDDEMHRTFNMGLGLVVAVSPEKAAAVKKGPRPLLTTWGGWKKENPGAVSVSFVTGDPPFFEIGVLLQSCRRIEGRLGVRIGSQF